MIKVGLTKSLKNVIGTYDEKTQTLENCLELIEIIGRTQDGSIGVDYNVRPLMLAAYNSQKVGVDIPVSDFNLLYEFSSLSAIPEELIDRTKEKYSKVVSNIILK